MSRRPLPSLGPVAALMALACVPAHAQTITPILQYNLNDSTNSNTTTNTGSSITNSTLSFLTAPGGTNTTTTAASLRSADLGGVSGLTGDYAFQDTSPTGMGRNPGTGGGAARNVGAGPGATTLPVGGPGGTTGLLSFTIQGWFKTDNSEVLGGDARLFSNAASNPSTIVTGTANQGFYLSGQGSGNTGQLQFVVNNSAVANSTAAFLSDTGTWTFYAVTYDGTGTTGQASFYRGTRAADGTGTVTLLNTATMTVTGVVQTNPAFFALGNFPNPDSTASFSRPFDGFLDDTRFYGSTTGNSGALNATQLETIRTADLLNVNPLVLAATPEPSQAAALGLGVLGLTGLACRARKRQAVKA